MLYKVIIHYIYLFIRHQLYFCLNIYEYPANFNSIEQLKLPSLCSGPNLECDMQFAHPCVWNTAYQDIGPTDTDKIFNLVWS